MNWRQFWCFIVLTGTYFVYPSSTTQAQVVISEVYPAPGVGESEWIELYNADTESIAVGGWSLFDQLTTPSVLYTFPLETSLDPLTYLVVMLTGSKLNNAGDGVELRNAIGDVVDRIVYTSSQSLMSVQRMSLVDQAVTIADPSPGSTNPLFPLSGNDPSPTPAPSPSTPSPTPTSAPLPTATSQLIISTTVDPSQIKLIEISACPAEGKESITLLNTGSTIFLDNWQLIDAAGNQKTISGLLNGQSTGTFEWTGSLLNNSGDSLSVVTTAGLELTSASYDDCQKGIPLVLSGDTWQSKNYEVLEEDTLSYSASASTTNALVSGDSLVRETDTENTARASSPSATTLKVQSRPSKPLGILATQLILTPPPLPIAVNLIPDETPPPETSPYPSWPAWSVIIGGLLQLLSSGYVCYDKCKFTSPPSNIFT